MHSEFIGSAIDRTQTRGVRKTVNKIITASGIVAARAAAGARVGGRVATRDGGRAVRPNLTESAPAPKKAPPPLARVTWGGTDGGRAAAARDSARSRAERSARRRGARSSALDARSRESSTERASRCVANAQALMRFPILEPSAWTATHHVLAEFIFSPAASTVRELFGGGGGVRTHSHDAPPPRLRGATRIWEPRTCPRRSFRRFACGRRRRRARGRSASARGRGRRRRDGREPQGAEGGSESAKGGGASRRRRTEGGGGRERFGRRRRRGGRRFARGGRAHPGPGGRHPERQDVLEPGPVQADDGGRRGARIHADDGGAGADDPAPVSPGATSSAPRARARARPSRSSSRAWSSCTTPSSCRGTARAS